MRGRITHIETEEPFIKSGYYFDSQYMVQRSLYIDNALYTLSPRMIKINDLTTLKELNKLELPFENPNASPAPEPSTVPPTKAAP